MTRTVTVTTEQLLAGLREVLAAANLDPDRLADLAARHGSDHVVSWMEDHSFWTEAEQWRNVAFLLGHTPTW